MDPAEHRRMMIVKAATFVTVIYAWVMTRLRLAEGNRERVTYASMSAMDKER